MGYRIALLLKQHYYQHYNDHLPGISEDVSVKYFTYDAHESHIFPWPAGSRRMELNQKYLNRLVIKNTYRDFELYGDYSIIKEITGDFKKCQILEQLHSLLPGQQYCKHTPCWDEDQKYSCRKPKGRLG